MESGPGDQDRRLNEVSLLRDRRQRLGRWARGPDGELVDEDRYRYDPYGEQENAETDLSADARENPLRFEGFYYDPGVRTYDMHARPYRPEVGRFLTEDRFEQASGDLALLTDPLTNNRYAFAAGNPVGNIEFDGHIGTTGDQHSRFAQTQGGDVIDRKEGETIAGPRAGTGPGGSGWSDRFNQSASSKPYFVRQIVSSPQRTVLGNNIRPEGLRRLGIGDLLDMAEEVEREEFRAYSDSTQGGGLSLTDTAQLAGLVVNPCKAFGAFCATAARTVGTAALKAGSWAVRKTRDLGSKAKSWIASRFGSSATQKTGTALRTYFPVNNGFLAKPTRTFLRPGERIDRYGGRDVSRFFSPTGTSGPARALPPGASGQRLRTFEVVKPFEVEAGRIAPAFGAIGGGVQFRTPVTLRVLLRRGIIREVP